MRLVILRHGHTEWNEAGRYQGQSNPPLSPLGRREAQGVARWLPRLLPPGSPVWCSDLVRAVETAALALPEFPTVPDARLRELHFGIFEGETGAGNAARHGSAFERWMTDPDRFPPEGGETPSGLEARVHAWLGGVRGSAARRLRSAGDHPVVVVTHGGPARVLIRALTGLTVEGAWQIPLPPAGVLLLEEGAAPRPLGPGHPIGGLRSLPQHPPAGHFPGEEVR